MKYWQMDKLMSLAFWMKKLRNKRAGGVKAWLMSEALVTWSKKPLNIVFET